MFVVIVTAAIENDISLFPDSQKELSQWIKLKLVSCNLSLSFDPATALSPSERWRAETKTQSGVLEGAPPMPSRCSA